MINVGVVFETAKGTAEDHVSLRYGILQSESRTWRSRRFFFFVLA